MVRHQPILFHWYQYTILSSRRRSSETISFSLYLSTQIIKKKSSKSTLCTTLYLLEIEEHGIVFVLNTLLQHVDPAVAMHSCSTNANQVSLYSVQPGLILCKTRDQGCKGSLGNQFNHIKITQNSCFYPKWHWQGIATPIYVTKTKSFLLPKIIINCK